MTTDPPTTELNEAESWALVRAAVVGRLAVVVDGRPEIFPVNYLVDHGSIVLRTAVGTKLAAALNQPVAFEVDGYDPSAGDAWSVVVKGVAREIKQLHEVVDVLDLPLDTWHPSRKPRLIRIEPTAVTGRRFDRADPPPPRSAARAAHE